MVRNTFWICLLLFVSCKNKEAKQNFVIPDTSDINEIVTTIITADSLSNRPNSPLSVDLEKITIVGKNVDTIPPLMGTNNLPLTALLDENSNKYFSNKDSSYFFFQNKIMLSFRLNSSFSKLIELTDDKQVIKKRTKQKALFRHYHISLPIFSKDRNTAYVAIDYHCPLCGYGMAIILRKINGKWKIMSQNQTWIS